MNKAFTKETDHEDDDEPEEASPLPVGTKNYITPAGYQRLKDEALHLLDKERPELTKVIQWAASNGDRSENADYIYGKRRLREIDRRIRFLTKRLDNAEVIDPATREATDQVFFGATVTVAREDGQETTYSIVGIDEADVARPHQLDLAARASAPEGPRGRHRGRAHAGGDEPMEIVSVVYRAIE
jgi:transcription elongation factor GreB